MMLMILKKVFRYTLYTLLGLLVFVALYLLMAWALSSIGTDREADADQSVEIWIMSNGVHTDLVVPVRNHVHDWSCDVLFAHTRNTDTSSEYLALGWGDKGFYLETPTWADLKFSTAFKAVTGLGNSAIHATFYKQMKEGEWCKKIRISQNQYKRLVSFVNHSFRRENGHLLHIRTQANYGQTDAFYEAIGAYSLFHTCNTWTNNALKSCGQKACWWTPFDKGIFKQYP